MSNELKPCPWCGETPELVQRDSARDESWQIVCVNSECPVGPASYWFSRREVIGQWNIQMGRSPECNEQGSD